MLGPVISQCPAFRPGRLVVCVVHALGSIFPDLGIPRSRLGFSCSPCAAGVECVPKKTQKKGRRRQERGAGFPRLRTYPRRHARRESPRLFQGCNIRPSDNSNENAKSALGPKTPPLRSGSPFVIHIRLNRVADRGAFCALDTAHVHCVLVFIEDSFKEQLRVPSGNAGAGSSFFHTPGVR